MDVQPPNTRSIFERALEFAQGGERKAYLDDACAGRPELRTQVESLLKAHGDAGSFLDGPAFDGQRTSPMEPIAERPGTTIGPYKLLEQIGEGGFGVVFMAEQEQPIRRRVAVKVIKPGMDTRQVIARFEAERQALALMDHPNIARVLDAGATDSGRPYFVMELVRGVPITEFCDHHRLAVDERLKLFATVCQAVQHAHQKGIIHRDIKPTNVLVTLHDGMPVAKVIDFGVAKATGQRLTDKTIFTAFAQMIGTPLYMSPEQTEMSGLDVDTRSDIYSLGVMLYELLTGTTPFDKERLQQAAYDEIRRIIREEATPKPSTRISALGATATAVSTQRQSDPHKLSDLVRGELDWIVMKCLEKDRNRRYETPNGLAMDVQRYLAGEAVVAAPPSAAYRLRKFARRHRIGLLAGSGAVLTLLILLVVLTVSNRIIAREGDRKEAAMKGEQQALHEAAKNLVLARENEQTARHALYAARINLAQQAADSADIDRILELLNSLRPEAGQEDLRGFEWYYLWRLCHAERRLLREFRDPVRCAVYSPDGKTLATSHGTEVMLWQPGTGELLCTLKGATGQVRSIAFSTDSALVAAGGGNESKPGEVHVWDMASRQEKFSLPQFSEPVMSVAFSPDGRVLAVGTANLTVERPAFERDRALPIMPGQKSSRLRLWDLASGQENVKPEGSSESILCVAFCPTAPYVAAGTYGGEIIVWETGTGTRKGLAKHTQYVSSVSFSPDGSILASGWGTWENPTGITLRRFPSLEPLRTMRDLRAGVTAVAFSPSGRSIAASSYDRTVTLWSVSEGELLHNFIGHSHFVSSIAFAPDGNSLASSGWDNDVRIWDAGDSSALKPIRPGGSTIGFLPDGRAMAGGLGRPLSLINRATGGTVTALEKMEGDVLGAISPDGTLLAASGSDGNIKLCETSTLSQRYHFQDGNEPVWGIAFSPDGRTLATAGNNDQVTFRDVESGRITEKFHPHGHQIKAIAFAPAGAGFATATWQGESCVQTWDLRSGQPTTLEGRGASCLAYSADGRLLAVGRRNTIVIYDTHTNRLLQTITGHSEDIWGIAFSPDGRTLATSGFDKTVRLWSVRSGQLLIMHPLDGVVWAVAFSRDGRTLAAITSTDTRFWDAVDPVEAEEHIDGVLHHIEVLRRAGRIADAEQFAAGMIRKYEQRWGQHHAWTARLMVERASLLTQLGNSSRYPEAETLLVNGRTELGRKIIAGHEWRWRGLYVARDLYGPSAMNDPRKLAEILAAMGSRSSTPTAATKPAKPTAESR